MLYRYEKFVPNIEKKGGYMTMVGEMIKDYLESNGIKKSFVADKIGITQARFSEILNKGRVIDCQLYFKICRALNVPLETFEPKDEDEED